MSVSVKDQDIFEVVVNGEGQYSIWPTAKTIPAGWDKAGCAGGKDTCLAFIRDHWTDMRPLSLQRAMDGESV